MISYKAAVASTPGGKSTHNGDNFYFNTRYLTEDLAESQVLLSHKKNQRGLQIYAVCDGSNADSQAEEASLILVKNLIKYHKKLVDNPSSDVPKTISEYIDSTNEQVNRQIQELMGKRIFSTLALLCVERESTLICSVGDSRVYSYIDGTLTQITEDHTQAQRMVQLGLLTPERALTHVKREKLTQYFGEMPAGMSIDPFMETALSKHGDTYILCTRGFYEAVPTEEMEKILAKRLSPSDTVDEMMAYAMDNGIKNDATVIVVSAYDTNKSAVPTASIASAAGAGITAEAAEENSPSTIFAHDDDSTPATDSKQQFEEYNENYDEPTEDVDSFIGKLLSPFRRGGKKNTNEFWPALIIFAVCILSVAVLSVFGYNLFLRNRNSELEPTKLPLPSATADGKTTPDISGPIKTAGPGGEGILDPDATPDGGEHGSNNDNPTEEPPEVTPAPEPTNEPTNSATVVPTKAPTPTPTNAPTPTPTNAPTPTPTEEPTPTEAPTEAPTPTPTEVPEPGPSDGEQE